MWAKARYCTNVAFDEALKRVSVDTSAAVAAYYTYLLGFSFPLDLSPEEAEKPGKCFILIEM